ncbi:MAG: pyrroline-5-carboxylate reductase [Proteobacteria bacterium]|nr:pyrroline-5-carboxylate reductase [Burkholderiales bacterium]
MNLCFVGGGNMACALIGGLLRNGFAAGDLTVIDVDVAQRERLSARFGVAVFATVAAAASAVAASDCVVLAVKPQHVRGVAQALQPLRASQLVVTIAAGVRIVDLARWLGGHHRIARAMPNTPALIGQGIAGLYAGAALEAADRGVVERILGAVGAVLWVEREVQIDALTAVSGSGPAYVFLLIEALEAAAREVGFDATQSRQLALATFAGASALAASDVDPPEVLRARVTSPGGTTERGIAAFEAGGVRAAFVRAVTAANQRASELGDAYGREQAANSDVGPGDTIDHVGRPADGRIDDTPGAAR